MTETPRDDSPEIPARDEAPRDPDATVPITRPHGPGPNGTDPDGTDPDAETSAEALDPARTVPLNPAGPTRDPAADEIPGYRLMGQIGRGGMGTVFLAQRLDDRFRKRVAIKIMRRGVDTDEMIERFQLERQVLGALNHPNIARLFDAGATADGRPYFVMEHVDGLPIDTYCDEHNLTVQERIRLFTKICAAVHYAHQNLIVHRDLKPSNILVTAEGEPKLLDFGIAKLLNPELLGLPALTRADQRIMTYEYASPEQVQGQAITTASDVYALGVILYELLTGHRPYQIQRRLHAEAVRVICEAEPERPSTAVSRAATRHTSHGEMHTITAHEIAKRREVQITRLKKSLAGDLDNIVLMAMRKSAHRRYSTAQALAEDLDRHLAGQTVTARAPTFVYRAGKFVRRHRFAVAAASTVLLALLVGLVAFSWAWQRAEHARAEEALARQAAENARAAEADARAAAETRYTQLRRMFTVEDELYDAIENLPAATAARTVLADAMLSAIDALAAEFPEDPRLRLDLAIQYQRVGRLAAAGENSVSRGVHALQRAAQLLAQIPDADEERLRTAVELAKALRQAGDRDAAFRVASDAANAPPHEEPDPLARLRAEALMQAGLVRLLQSRADDARPLLQSALAIAQDAAARAPSDPDTLATLAYAHEQLGFLHDFLDQEEPELAAFQRCLEFRARVAELRPDDADAARRLVMAHERVGRALMDLDRFDEAEASYRDMQALARSASDADPFSGRALSDLARSFEAAADLALRRRQPEVAQTYAAAFAAHAEEAFQHDPTDLAKRRMLGLAQYKLARTLIAQDKRAEALPSLAAALQTLTEAGDIDPADAELRRNQMLVAYHLGVNSRATGDTASARDAFRRVIQQARALAAATPLNASDRDLTTRAANGICAIAHDADNPDEMIATVTESTEILGERPFLLTRQHIRALILSGDLHAALDLTRDAIKPYDALSSPSSADQAQLDELRRLEAECLAALEAAPGFDDPIP